MLEITIAVKNKNKEVLLTSVQLKAVLNLIDIMLEEERLK